MPHDRLANAKEEFKPSVYLDFPNKSRPVEFKDLTIDDDVMVVLRGKVTSLSHHHDSSSINVEYDKLEIVGGAKPKTMDQVLDQIQENRKA